MNQSQLSSVAPLSASDSNTLLLSAQALKHASLSGSVQKSLRGKHLGLVCEDQQSEDAVLFLRAGTELGARVAQVNLGESRLLVPEGVADTARVLGRLYDGIECQGLTANVVQRIRDAAGVPVYDGIATARHLPSVRSRPQQHVSPPGLAVLPVRCLPSPLLRGHQNWRCRAGS